VTDPSVLLFHGYPTWAEVWLPLFRSLGARAWIAPDLPCHDKSSVLPGKDRSLTAYRRAVTAFVDALRLPKLAVVGSSMGGSLGIMLALDRPDLVERLVLLDAAGLTAKIPGRAVRLYLPFLLPCFVRAPGPGSVRELLRKGVFFDPRYADDAWVRTIVEEWAPRARRSAFVATGFALRRRDASIAADLGRVRVPTLVVWGRQDPQYAASPARGSPRWRGAGISRWSRSPRRPANSCRSSSPPLGESLHHTSQRNRSIVAIITSCLKTLGSAK